MPSAPAFKPTPTVRAILRDLASGAVLVPDAHNVLWLAGKPIGQNTREVLMRERLVTRLDKSRDIKAAGNGFVITERGRELLGSQ